MRIENAEIEFELLVSCWQCDGGYKLKSLAKEDLDGDGKCGMCHGKNKLLTSDGDKVAELIEFLK